MPGTPFKGRERSQFKQLEFAWQTGEMPSLPSAENLQEHATTLLRRVRGGDRLQDVRVEWNSRMRTAVGRADYGRSTISLNPALQKFGPEEIERTLRHELAHLVAQSRAGRRAVVPHGREWQRACRDLGIARERACHKLPLPAGSQRRKFLYRCPNCGGNFPRVRRIRRNTACLACCRRFRKGNYDEAFRLQLVPSPRVM